MFSFKHFDKKKKLISYFFFFAGDFGLEFDLLGFSPTLLPFGAPKPVVSPVPVSPSSPWLTPLSWFFISCSSHLRAARSLCPRFNSHRICALRDWQGLPSGAHWPTLSFRLLTVVAVTISMSI